MKKPADKEISEIFPEFAVHFMKRGIIDSMASTAPQIPRSIRKNTASHAGGNPPHPSPTFLPHP
jgi:hypothetical protein